MENIIKSAPETLYEKLNDIISNLDSKTEGSLKSRLIGVLRSSLRDPIRISDLLPSIYNFMFDINSDYVRDEGIKYANYIMDNHPQLVTQTLVDIIKVFLNVEIVRVDPFKDSCKVGLIASVYQQSFGGRPWNEGFKCPICEKSYPITYEEKTCPHCPQQVLLVEYWPTGQIISDFYKEMQKTSSLSLVAEKEKEVVGFAWGYGVSVNEDLENHLEASGLCDIAKGDFFYLDEVAILPNWQGKGIGSKLLSQIFKEQDQDRIILRTLKNSVMHVLIEKMKGRIILPISRNRVIMQLDL